jgi:hypothetical protein
LVEAEVCALSGLLPGRDCPHRVTELFVEGTEPAETCTMHQCIALDRTTGLRATDATPPDRIVERVYAVLPPDAQEWAREQGIPEPPILKQQLPSSQQRMALASLEAKQPLIMSSPDDGAVYRLDPALPRDAQRIEVAARVGTRVSLVEVTLLVDGQPLARLGAPPYRAYWQLESGIHVFSSEGVDVNGERVMSDKVWVDVRQR